MTKLYLLLFFRSVNKSKVYFGLNIVGLSLSIASIMAIAIVVNQQFDFDKFHKNYGSIYRVNTYSSKNDKVQKLALAQGSLKIFLQSTVPEVHATTKILKYTTHPLFKVKDKSFVEDEGLFVDSDFNKVFSYHFIAGDRQTMFLHPNAIAISEKLALKYFNTLNVLGKVITLNLGEGNTDVEMIISGVFENLPVNSHLQFDYLISGHSLEWWDESVDDTSFYVYVMLKENESKSTVSKIQMLLRQRQSEFMKQKGEKLNSGDFVLNTLQPITDIHFDNSYLFELASVYDKIYIYILIMIGTLIVLSATINSVNFNTTFFLKRLKEIGVRKTMGSTNRQLISNSILECLLCTVLTIAFAVLITESALQFTAIKELLKFNSIMNNSKILLIMTCFTFLLFSVSYIVFARNIHLIQLSTYKSFNNTKRLKPINMRNVLITLQLVSTIVFLSFASIAMSQLSFLRTKDIGFDKSNVVTLNPPSAVSQNTWNDLKMQLKTEHNIYAVGQSSFNPFGNYFYTSLSTYENRRNKTALIKAFYTYVDEDYIRSIGFNIIKGQNFSSQWSFENPALILNEAAYIKLGGLDILDKPLWCQALYGFNPEEKATVVGVIKDFHSQSFSKTIEPLVLIYTPGDESIYPISVKFKKFDISKDLARIEDIWNNSGIESSFEYKFLEDDFVNVIKPVMDLNSILLAFTVLSICVTVTGLVGLMGNLTQQRAKEISIKKVLGASLIRIVVSLNKSSIIIFCSAAVFAIPIIVMCSNYWLSNFAYKVSVDYSSIALTLIIAFLILLVTVSVQSLKAAIKNPLNNLRQE